MNLQKLLKIFSDKACKKIYAKKLSANDNSKNQVYLGGSFDVLNILPVGEIVADNKGDWKRTRFKTKIHFSWLNEDGLVSLAPSSQLILYPKYPEVRFSGFLKKVEEAPSDLMANRIEGRYLFFGVTDKGTILGYVVSPDSQIAREIEQSKSFKDVGVFKEIILEDGKVEVNARERLLFELHRIHHLGWIDAKRLNSSREIIPCISSNCGGYTLEAELGITPNGYSQPDFLGWEVKQFGVTDFKKQGTAVITLMTPEPTGGIYVDDGIESFIRRFGYKDKMGREERINFGGIYKNDILTETTGLTLKIEGFDKKAKKIRNADGYIALIDPKDNIAASWSFSSLLKHWNTKHAHACYVPSMKRKDDILYPFSKQQFCYGNNILLGSGTDFSLVLDQIAEGNVYYDPGIKLELAVEGQRKQTIKRRSQFRVKSKMITTLYKENEKVELLPIKR